MSLDEPPSPNLVPNHISSLRAVGSPLPAWPHEVEQASTQGDSGHLKPRGSLGNARAWRPSLSADEIDKSAADRLARQRVLDNTAQQFWFIVNEAALRRTEGGPVMKAQIMRLVEIIDRPNVELQVVPFSVGYYMGQGHDYTIFGYDTKPAVDIIYLEQHDGGEYVDNSKRTARYLTLWDHQKAAASGPEQTRRALLDIASSW